MRNESPQERIMRLQKAINAIVLPDPYDSFARLVENNKESYLKGLGWCIPRITYNLSFQTPP